MMETIVLCCGLMNIREVVTDMWYVLGGMVTGVIAVAAAECFIGRYA